jgi:ell wall binding domain 2 (CWB2)
MKCFIAAGLSGALVAIGLAVTPPLAHAAGSHLIVYAGYADCKFTNCDNTMPRDGAFPAPWAGDSRVTLAGDPVVAGADDPDVFAIRIDNPSGTSVKVDDVKVTCGDGSSIDEWGSPTIPANGILVLSQVAGDPSLDGSEETCAGDTVVVTLAGAPSPFADVASPTGGTVLYPPSSSNEDVPWTQLGASGGGPTPQRLAGVDRLGTAIAVSQHDFPQEGSAKAVVLARSDQFPDALAGIPLAVKTGGPLLLTPPDHLDSAVASELQRVLPSGSTVYLLGGLAALSAAVESSVAALPYTVVRYAGSDRDSTAVAVAHIGLGDPANIIEATGSSPFDALSGGAAAAVSGAAILLTDGAAPSPDTTAYLAARPGDKRTAVGGPAAAADPSALALVGQDRDTTSALVAQHFFTDPATVGVATDSGFADALSGGADVARAGGPILLVPTFPPMESSTTSYLGSVGATVTALFVYGGDDAIDPSQASAIQTAL